MDIKYSVLVPVYNVEKYLEQCIESVINQTYQNFELILMDDGSTDSSGFICEKYVKNDTRVRVYHQENQGLLITRRNLLKYVEGDYCLFLDSDDYWDINLLKNVDESIKTYHCDMVIYNFKRVTSKGTFINKSILKDKHIYDSSNKAEIFEHLIDSSDLNNLWIKGVKRLIIDDTDYTQYKKLKQSEDLLQSLPLLYNAEKIVYIDKPMYNYRQNLNSISNTISEHALEDISVSRSILLSYIKKLKIDNEENLKKFYFFYMESVIDYISELINSNISKNRKIETMNRAKEIGLYIDANKNKFNFPVYKRIRHYLFEKGCYSLLFLYEKILTFFRAVKNALFD